MDMGASGTSATHATHHGQRETPRRGRRRDALARAEDDTAQPGDARTAAALHTAARAAYGPASQIALWHMTELTNRGGRRVVRYDLLLSGGATGETRQVRWIGKFYESAETAARVAATLRGLEAAGYTERCGATVPRVVSYDPGLRLLLATFEPGEPVVSRLDGDWHAIVPAVARALAALHALPAPDWGNATPAEIVADLRRRVDALCGWLPDQAAALRSALASQEQRAARLPTPAALTHGDFGAGQLLWQRGRLVVLDFDKCGRGDPALDLGNFTAQLRRRALLDGLAAPIHEMRNLLLDVYTREAGDAAGDRGDLTARVTWYEHMVLLRRVHFFARQGSDEWRERALRLLQLL
jgi:aminoglycoside phosphotransferase (APT) family kinase protein